jgi:hypothetical protein
MKALSLVNKVMPHSDFYPVDFEEDHKNGQPKSTPIAFRNADLCAEADTDDSIYSWVRSWSFEL